MMKNELGKISALIALALGVLLAVLGLLQGNKVILGIGMILLGPELSVYGWRWLGAMSDQQLPSAMHDPDGYRAHKNTEGFFVFMIFAGVALVAAEIVTLFMK